MMRGPDGERLRVGRYVDPQDIFEGLRSHYATGEASNIPAKDFAARAIERAFTVNFEHIKKRKDLTAVCSLGSVTDMDLIDAARQQGYYISFYYMGVRKWEICCDYIRRTKDHWLARLSDNDIFGNYHRSLATLPGAIIAADNGAVIDNSVQGKSRPLLEIRDGRIQIIDKNLPDWVLDPLSRCL